MGPDKVFWTVTMFWVVFGACIGLAQWLALRVYRPVAPWWVGASALGGLFFGLGQPAGPLGWVTGGLCVGLLQFGGLRRYRGAFWWIIVNPVAWGIAGWFDGRVPMLASNPVLAWTLRYAFVGLLAAAILLAPLSQIRPKA